IEDIAGEYDVGTAEEDNSIAIGMRRRLMKDFNTLAVEVHVFPRLIEGFRRPGGNRKRRRLPARPTHSGQDLFDRKYRRASSEKIGADTGSAALCKQRLPGFRDDGVAAHMIRVGAGVDQIANGMSRDSLDGCD